MTTLTKLQAYLKAIEKDDKKGKKINAFLELNPDAEKQAREVDEKIKKSKAGKLAGKIIAVKSNILVQGLKASCASKTLENYKSPYDATVIEKIKKQDGIIIGMTNCDEFACGSSGENSAFGPTKNPAALNLIPGGSSSGSATATAAGFCDMALGSDTGGSIRNPASHCGVVGLKPSYGAVSRYGLIDLGMSLDQIGTFAKNIDDAKLLFEIIKGKDEKEATSKEFPHNKKEIKTIALIKEMEKLCTDKRIYKLVKEKAEEAAKKHNWKIKEISLKHLDLAIQTYYPIVYVEFFSGTRKFDGRRFGKKIEDSCGKEVLRRILGGSEISKAEFAGKYYRRALKAREIIKKEFEDAFKDVDAIILPTVPRLPHKIGEKISLEDMYGYDALTIPANLAGICAISIPAGKISSIPVGMQIFCAQGDENLMFECAKKF